MANNPMKTKVRVVVTKMYEVMVDETPQQAALKLDRRDEKFKAHLIANAYAKLKQTNRSFSVSINGRRTFWDDEDELPCGS